MNYFLHIYNKYKLYILYLLNKMDDKKMEARQKKAEAKQRKAEALQKKMEALELKALKALETKQVKALKAEAKAEAMQKKAIEKQAKVLEAKALNKGTGATPKYNNLRKILEENNIPILFGNDANYFETLDSWIHQ